MAGSAPRLSIGLPVFNGERWVARAIQSLLEQSYRDFVLVVSDNASTDGTEQVVRGLAAEDPRIRYVRQPENRGGAWNFNEVFRLRDPGSEFFKWQAADDQVRPGFLEALIPVLDEQPDVVLTHCRSVDVFPDGSEQLQWPSPGGDDPDVVRRFADYTRHRHAALQQFGVVRSAVLARTALLAPFSDADLSLLAEISLHGRLVDVDEVLFARHVHDQQSTAAFRTRRERMTWWDPESAERLVLVPTWLMGRELLRAIDRAPLTREQRSGCLRALLPWAADSGLRLGNDLASSARAVAQHALAGVRRAAR